MNEFTPVRFRIEEDALGDVEVHIRCPWMTFACFIDPTSASARSGLAYIPLVRRSTAEDRGA